MIGFGPGFECNKVVWEWIQPASSTDGPWSDCIHRAHGEAPTMSGCCPWLDQDDYVQAVCLVGALRLHTPQL
ncbi:hypothetical protein EJB05_45340, partial [Eragrostis curvula]